MAEMTSYAAGTPCWIDLATPDMAAAREFYGELLGWEFDEGPPESGGYTMATLRGRNVAGLMAQNPQAEQPAPPSWTTYLASGDVGATAAAVGAAGGTVLMGPDEVMDQGSLLVWTDPSGALAGAWQPGRHTGAQLANEPGSFIWNELVTRDLAGARAFYTEVFGYQTDEMDLGFDQPYVVLKVAGEMVGGMVSMPSEWPPQLASSWLTYFAVDNVERSLEAVRSAGGSTLAEPRDAPYGRFAVVADPQGAAFSILTPPPS
ncbi:MAG: VOC family protein [Actinomycetota bacterium]|nr:VOC family protein [Actinomycetota bacterium]